MFDSTKYIGSSQSKVDKKGIKLHKMWITQLKEMPHYYKVFTYRNLDGELHNGILIFSENSINDDSKIKDILCEWLNIISVDDSQRKEIKLNSNHLIVDSQMEEKCNFKMNQLVTVFGIMYGYIIFCYDEKFFRLTKEELEAEVKEIFESINENFDD